MSCARWRVGAVAALTVFLLSCATGTSPRWRYDSAGEARQYKRYPRNIAVDYFSRFRRVAYVKVNEPLEAFLSEEQRQWISQYGQPEYRRRPFRSREGEKVEEWVSLAHNKLTQFVGGGVVYAGEVTDMERTMIRLGYPRGCLISQAEPEIERLTFIYSRPFDLEREVFSFSNGKLVFRQTQR